MQIELLLELGVKQEASDLHLIPGAPPLIRVNGELIELDDMSVLSSENVKDLVYSVMSLEQQEELESKLTCDLAVFFPAIGNFRLNVFQQMNGLAAAFRIVSSTIPTIDELDLPPIFKRFASLAHGLILIVGPTGSGKSTTLAAMVDYINKTQSRHIITIEDPIEFIHKRNKSVINQIQVGRDTPDFSTALRASLRQSPDVILLGEMRDLEAIRIALMAAETGHLVLTSLHASTAPLSISRIIDAFPTNEKNRIRIMLSETLQASVCQTLVKKKIGGRVAAFEIMLSTAAIRHYIHQDMIAQMESTIQTSGDIGMCTMAQYMQILIERRIISPTVARNLIAGRESFKSTFEGRDKRR
jgi:twitching motility protein PilT